MKKLKQAFEIETEDTIFSGGEHRKVIIIFAPPSLLGFRLKGSKQTFWLTSGGCFDVAVKNGKRFEPRFNLRIIITIRTSKDDYFYYRL